MFVAEPAHVLELAIVVHSRESRNVISAICVANFLFQTCCLNYLVTNQILISSRCDGWYFSKIYDVGSGKVDVLADTPSLNIYYCGILIEKINHILHEDSVRLILEVVPYGFFALPKFDIYLVAMLMLLSMIMLFSTSRRTLEAEC